MLRPAGAIREVTKIEINLSNECYSQEGLGGAF